MSISRMWPFIGLTVALCAALSFLAGYMRREEIMANWSKYRSDPLYMFAAPLFKPDGDPRSPVQFASDNFFDNISMMVTKVFAVFLEPIFKIFKLFVDSITQTSDGLFNIKALFANMWDKWNKMVDPFMRRFYTVFHRFRVTFIKLFSSMEKSYGVAISSIYGGLSVIYTMLSFLDLMVNIVIAILITLIILVLLPPFVLIPLIPLILLGIFMVSETASAGGVEGMASIFCFAKATLVETQSGPQTIESLSIGDRFKNNEYVLGTMKFDVNSDELFELYDIIVSGTHIVYQNGKPIHVKDHKDAKPYKGKPQTELYCLITTDRKIPVVGKYGIVQFADWEEFQTDVDLQTWHKQVFRTLNTEATEYTPPSMDVLYSESVFSEYTRIQGKNGPKYIKDILPGDYIKDGNGFTRVNGIVHVDASEVRKSVAISNGALMSIAAWYFENGVWKQTSNAKKFGEGGHSWYSLFTESGTFQIHTTKGLKTVRDFTDIGPDHIHETYDWVLQSLQFSIRGAKL